MKSFIIQSKKQGGTTKKTAIILIVSLMSACLGFSKSDFDNVSTSVNRNSKLLATQRLSKEANSKERNGFYQTAKIFSNSRIKLSNRDYSTYVYTPNGTPISVDADEEADQSFIEYLNGIGDDWVPEATRIANSSVVYNCHSYAWYMQSTSNPYWMDCPNDYYTDGSYEINTGNVGDIICYYDEDDVNIHSGIVTSRLSGVSNEICGDADLVTVRSKWGSLGLYDHRGDQCPYTSTYGGDAEYVIYYKPREKIPFLYRILAQILHK